MKDLNHDSIRRLFCAIIEQAFLDLKRNKQRTMFASKSMSESSKRTIRKNANIELYNFFVKGGADVLIDSANLKISKSRLREKAKEVIEEKQRGRGGSYV